MLPGKVSNLESPGSEPGVLPITPPGNGVSHSLSRGGLLSASVPNVTASRGGQCVHAANAWHRMQLDRDYLAATVTAAFNDRTLLNHNTSRKAIERVVGALDNGWLR